MYTFALSQNHILREMQNELRTDAFLKSCLKTHL